MRNAISAECCIKRGDAKCTVKGHYLIVSSVFFDLIMPIIQLSITLYFTCSAIDRSTGMMSLFLWALFSCVIGCTISRIRVSVSQFANNQKHDSSFDAFRINQFVFNINVIATLLSLAVLILNLIFKF